MIYNYTTYTLSICIFAVSLFGVSLAYCPPAESISNEVQSCFSDFSTQMTYVSRSDQKLYAGIDVEILRAYCR